MGGDDFNTCVTEIVQSKDRDCSRDVDTVVLRTQKKVVGVCPLMK